MTVDSVDMYSLILMAIISFGGPVLVWWGSSKALNAKFEQWKESVDKSVESINEKLERYFNEDRENYASLSVHGTDIKRAERDIEDLREWKHVVAQPYIAAMDHMNLRVSRIEKYLNGKLAETHDA